jgi:hypothetical protein
LGSAYRAFESLRLAAHSPGFYDLSLEIEDSFVAAAWLLFLSNRLIKPVDNIKRD